MNILFALKKAGLALILFMLTTLATSSTYQVTLSENHNVGDQFMKIRLHGTLLLPNDNVGWFKASELSDLAWDEDEQILYAISDHGTLFYLQPVIQNNTLMNVNFVKGIGLKRKGDKKRRKWDIEGLDILNGNNGVKGDSELVISFERKARIARFSTQGILLEEYPLPKALSKEKYYSGSNHMLEAVIVHPTLGILTAPEQPFKGNEEIIVIHALDGQEWKFPCHPAKNSAVVALETLDDGTLLVLERAYSSEIEPIIISLRQFNLKTMEVTQLAEFDNTKGWNIDNFEGLAHHHDNYFFMVSDNNDNPLQKSLLTYFEVLP